MKLGDVKTTPQLWKKFLIFWPPVTGSESSFVSFMTRHVLTIFQLRIYEFSHQILCNVCFDLFKCWKWGEKKSFFELIKNLFTFSTEKYWWKKNRENMLWARYISFNASSLIHSWGYENGRDFYKKNNQIAIAINKQKPTIFMFQGPLEPSSRSWIILCNLYFYPNTFHQYIILHHFWNRTVFSEILTCSFFIFFSIDDRYRLVFLVFT